MKILWRVLPLALLVLYAGPVSAQQMNCAAWVANPAMVRAEGLSELVGDFGLQCFGGPSLQPGSPIPRVNISVTLNAPLTSRLLDPATGASEALLLINEPGADIAPAVNGYGPAAPQILCVTPFEGCAENAGLIGPAVVPVLPGVLTPPSVQATPNVFQAIQTGPNQITFFGVPVLPGSVFSGVPPFQFMRIVNVRVNAASMSVLGGMPFGPPAITAGITVTGTSPSGLVPLPNPVLVTGFVMRGFLSSSVANGLGGCPAAVLCPLATVRFTEQFASAAKPRMTTYGPGMPPTPQNRPGIGLGSSESGFYAPALGATNPTVTTAGLADFGTRLKAVINVPPGIRVWVGTGNSHFPTTPYANATLTASEGGPFQSVPAGAAWGTLGLAELPVVNGAATAIWEVLIADPAQMDFFEFAIFATSGTPIPEAMPLVVRGTVAPNPDGGAFPLDGGFARGAAYPIPRFLSPPAILMPLLTVISPGQPATVPLALSTPALPGGVAVTLASSDSSVADVVPNVQVLGGAITPDRRGALMTGGKLGMAMITATAAGYDSAMIAIWVTLSMSFSPAGINVGITSRQERPLLRLSGPAPPGGITVTLTSDNPAIAAVPPTVFIPADALSVPVPVTPTGIGPTTIHAVGQPFLYAVLPVMVVP